MCRFSSYGRRPLKWRSTRAGESGPTTGDETQPKKDESITVLASGKADVLEHLGIYARVASYEGSSGGSMRRGLRPRISP